MKLKDMVVKKVRFDNVQAGKDARADRKKANVSLRLVAKTMSISEPYLSDLESGKRNWNTELADKFNAALKKLA